MDFNWNDLFGPIPTKLANCKDLRLLSLSRNSTTRTLCRFCERFARVMLMLNTVKPVLDWTETSKAIRKEKQ
jgi:hypothetical protein